MVQSVHITGTKFEILLYVKKSSFLNFNYHISQNVFFLSLSSKRYIHKNMRLRQQDGQKSPQNRGRYIQHFNNPLTHTTLKNVDLLKHF